MSWDEELDNIGFQMYFDSYIGRDILFSGDAPAYVVRNHPLPNFGFVLRDQRPSFNQIIFSINFLVQWDSSTGIGTGHADNDIDTTIQVTARTLLRSDGEAIATFLSLLGIRPGMHLPILDQICREARSMLADPANEMRLVFSVRYKILNGVPVAVEQEIHHPDEAVHGVQQLRDMIRTRRFRGDVEDGINGFDGGPATESSIRALKRVAYFPSCEVASSDCPICLQEFEAGMELTEMPCSHVFHGGCIEKWLRRRQTCPLCRRRMQGDNMTPR